MPRKYSGPLQPGTRSAMVPKGKPRRYTRKTVPVKQVTRLIKNVALKNCETKRSAKFEEGKDLLHNITVYQTGLLATSQGDDNPDGANRYPGSREGAEIIARGLNFKFYLERVKADTHYKIIVFKYKSGDTVNDGSFWQGGTGTGANDIMRIIDTIETSRFKVLKQLIVQPSGHGWYTKELNFYINLRNMRVKYPSGYNESNTTPDGWDIGFAVVGCDKIATATTDKVGELNYAWKLTYKDP